MDRPGLDQFLDGEVVFPQSESGLRTAQLMQVAKVFMETRESRHGMLDAGFYLGDLEDKSGPELVSKGAGQLEGGFLLEELERPDLSWFFPHCSAYGGQNGHENSGGRAA